MCIFSDLIIEFQFSRRQSITFHFFKLLIIESLRILVNFGRGLPFCPFPSVMREEPYLAGLTLSHLL